MELNKWRTKKCFGVLLVVFTILWSLLNGYCNVSAITKDYSKFRFRLRYVYSDSYTTSREIFYNDPISGVRYIDRVALAVGEIGTIPTNAEYLVVSGKVNLVYESASVSGSLAYQEGESPFIFTATLNGSDVTIINKNLNVYTTDWCNGPNNCNYIDLNGNSTYYPNHRTFTYEYQFMIPSSQFPNSAITNLSVGFEYPGKIVNPQCNLQSECTAGNFYFEGVPSNRLIADFSVDNQSALLQQQIQIQQLQYDSIVNLNNTVNEHYERENQAYDDIASQSASDIQGSTNQQTTNIIGFIGSFVTALGNIEPSNCELTLPFPNFAGGSKTVNICDGKQYAPSIVSVAGSLLLILTFVPLGFIVLRMIYNEIRSWTNG